MGRRAGADEHIMLFPDRISGDDIGLKYRMPTDEERVEYQDKSFSFRNGKLKTKAYQVRKEMGLRILTGIVDGAFEVQRQGKWVEISSNPQAQEPYLYDPDWREIVRRDGADLIADLAMAIFEPSAGTPQEAEEDGAKNSRSSQHDSLTPTG